MWRIHRLVLLLLLLLRMHHGNARTATLPSSPLRSVLQRCAPPSPLDRILPLPRHHRIALVRRGGATSDHSHDSHDDDDDDDDTIMIDLGEAEEYADDRDEDDESMDDQDDENNINDRSNDDSNEDYDNNRSGEETDDTMTAVTNDLLPGDNEEDTTENYNEVNDDDVNVTNNNNSNNNGNHYSDVSLVEEETVTNHINEFDSDDVDSDVDDEEEEEEEIPIDTTLIQALINDPDVRIKRPSIMDDDKGSDDTTDDDEDEEATYSDQSVHEEDDRRLQSDDPITERDMETNLPPTQPHKNDNEDSDTDSTNASISTTTTTLSSDETPVVDEAMRQILIQKLQYTAREVDRLIPAVAQMIVSNNLFRPPEGVPTHWLLPPPESDDLSLSSSLPSSNYVSIVRRILIQRIIPAILIGACVNVATTTGRSPFGVRRSRTTAADRTARPYNAATPVVVHTTTTSDFQSLPVDQVDTEPPDQERPRKSIPPVTTTTDRPRLIPPVDEEDATWLDKFITRMGRQVKRKNK